VTANGAPGFAIAGVIAGSSAHRLRVGHAQGETVAAMDGQSSVPLSELVSAFQVQVISSQVHELVDGAPSERRRLLDWGVFHVEHRYLRNLQNYRRLLRQRTALLQKSLQSVELDTWEDELAKTANLLDLDRRAFFKTLDAQFTTIGSKFFHFDADLDYFRGWPVDEDLSPRLRESRATDAERGFAQAGPHRADLRLRLQGHAVKNRSSRGQQKMLGAGLVLAAMSALPEATVGGARSLLVDEPAADLDSDNFHRLCQAILGIPAQIFVATLRRDTPFDDTDKRVFHVEHGEVKPLI
jgi:DNA replication and repair protein RecF